ncbi:hypothetical protein AWB81_05221 [Caballeronia arationis]|uniref:hypothetical protein n=1 Tax=Caballeronia arationis TaxID=1777142 RepID=UPI00074B92C8|nr:hypothetical protein [Caballeronia arationis]SAK94907.1 hypothetical protein AWB81_05221 [Caballeronia arationis]
MTVVLYATAESGFVIVALPLAAELLMKTSERRMDRRWRATAPLQYQSYRNLDEGAAVTAAQVADSGSSAALATTAQH